MSMAKGSGAGRTRGQAYQNKTAFRHNKGSKKTAAILATVNTGGLCSRCADKIEWRKKVGFLCILRSGCPSPYRRNSPNLITSQYSFANLRAF